VKEPIIAIVGELDMPDILDIVNRVDTHTENSQKVIIPLSGSYVEYGKTDCI
jgi:hypothetical protein